jgi:hypothetical protein
MDLKIQRTKLPEFWGQKEKDLISANEFIKRLDKMMSANNWSDKVAFDNFGLALKGEANTWLDSQVILKKIMGDREHWTIIRPFFKEEFATESDDKLILDGLAHMAMRSSENIRDFFGRLNKVNTIILDAYQGYTLAPQDLVPDQTGNITMTQAEHQAYKKALVENVMEFYLLNQFRAALPLDLRRVINLQPMHTLVLDTAVRLATIELGLQPGAHPGSKLSNRRKTRTTSRLSLRTNRRSFTPKLNKTGVNRAVKISDHRTTTETTKVNHNGGTTTLATTQTAIK